MKVTLINSNLKNEQGREEWMLWAASSKTDTVLRSEKRQYEKERERKKQQETEKKRVERLQYQQKIHELLLVQKPKWPEY